MQKNRLLKPPFTVERDIEQTTIEHTHQHESGQLIYMKKGILIGQVAGKQWLLQKGMLIWIPPNTNHHAECKYSANLTVVYIAKSTVNVWPAQFLLMDASQLAIGIIDALANKYVSLNKAICLLDLLLEEVVEGVSSKNILPLPTDRRLIRITQSIIDNLADNVNLKEWGYKVGASERTLSRLFIKETGLSYKGWVNRLKHNKAIIGLASGLTNEKLSLVLGFASGDSFSHWFQKEFNETPTSMKKRLLNS